MMSTAPVPTTATPPPAPHPMPEPPQIPVSEPVAPPQLGFWQQPKTVDIVSFASSLAIHLFIIGVGLIAFGVRPPGFSTQQAVEQPIIPDAVMIEGAQIGGIPNPGLGGDPNRPAAQDQVKDVSAASDSWKQRRADSLTQSL